MLPVPAAQMRKMISYQAAVTQLRSTMRLNPASCAGLLSAHMSCRLQSGSLNFTSGKCELAGDNCVLWLGSQTVGAHFKTLNFFIQECLVQYKSSLFLINEHMAN